MDLNKNIIKIMGRCGNAMEALEEYCFFNPYFINCAEAYICELKFRAEVQTCMEKSTPDYSDKKIVLHSHDSSIQSLLNRLICESVGKYSFNLKDWWGDSSLLYYFIIAGINCGTGPIRFSKQKNMSLSKKDIDARDLNYISDLMRNGAKHCCPYDSSGGVR